MPRADSSPPSEIPDFEPDGQGTGRHAESQTFPRVDPEWPTRAAELFDLMPQLGWAAQPDGYIDFYNRGWYDYTGTSHEEMKGWGWQSVHHPDELPRVMEAWTGCIASGRPFELTFPLRGRDGSFRWFLTRVKPIRDDAGRLLGWIGINTDVDEQRAAERSAERSRETAERAVRAREDLLAMVSHDLRNPLGSVLLGAKFIEGVADPSPAGQKIMKAAGTILRAVDRMTRLVGDLLDLAKLEAGHPLTMELASCDLSEVVREATSLLEPLLHARRLELRTKLERGTFASCDRDRVEQVISNLVGNAIKFTREGGVVTVVARRHLREIVVSVEDTGAGIPAAQLASIFQPYWQGEAEAKRGAGLGLFIAKSIVDAHGGRIWSESVEGRGSTFFFALPALDDSSTSDAENG